MALSYVQSAKTQKASSSALSINYAATPASGNLLFAAVYVNEHAGAVTITGPSGWTQIPTDSPSDNASNVKTALYYKTAGASEPTHVTGSLSSAVSWGMVVWEFNSDTGGTWNLDQSAHSTGTSTAPASGTTATTSQANEICVAAIGVGNANPTLSAPTNGFTLQETGGAGSSSSGVVYGGLYKIVSATGTQGTAVTSSSQPWAGIIATFYVGATTWTGAATMAAVTTIAALGFATRSRSVAFSATATMAATGTDPSKRGQVAFASHASLSATGSLRSAPHITPDSPGAATITPGSAGSVAITPAAAGGVGSTPDSPGSLPLSPVSPGTIPLTPS